GRDKAFIEAVDINSKNLNINNFYFQTAFSDNKLTISPVEGRNQQLADTGLLTNASQEQKQFYLLYLKANSDNNDDSETEPELPEEVKPVVSLEENVQYTIAANKTEYLVKQNLELGRTINGSLNNKVEFVNFKAANLSKDYQGAWAIHEIGTDKYLVKTYAPKDKESKIEEVEIKDIKSYDYKSAIKAGLLWFPSLDTKTNNWTFLSYDGTDLNLGGYSKLSEEHREVTTWGLEKE
ncbi:MAG: hypothetical protein LBM13_00795, partial [Candidatus Ancillula sp.]|nr:hypothetical protein [Candidatus Ancillula sp.]